MSSRKTTRPSRSPSVNPDLGKAGFGGGHRRDGPGVTALRQPFAAAQAAFVAVAAGAQPLAGDGFKLLKVQRLQLLLFAVAGDGAGQRMGGKAFQRIGQLGNFRFRGPAESFPRFQRAIRRW